MFDWLEMAAADTLKLNPADLVVDESLPWVPMTSKITSFFETPPTDEEVKAALPLRTAARKTVVDELKRLQDWEKSEKKGIAGQWNSSNPDRQAFFQTILDQFKSPEYKDLIKFLKTELVWWNTNVKISTTTVDTRAVNFKETLAIKQDIYRKANQESAEKKNKKKLATTEAEKKKKEAVMNRTIKEDIFDSITMALQYVTLIIYILIALRFASFAANANLYKPAPYRVLAFIYTFIFAPVVGPYYLWKEIKSWVWPDTNEPPLYESFFPMTPYDPHDEPTLNRRLFGYADTEGLQRWIKEQQANELAAKQAAVSHNIRAELIADRNKV